MSDGGGPPNASGPDEAPSKSIWDRYRDAATWVKVALPVVILAVLVGLGAIIANALSDDSTTTSGSTTTAPNTTTALLLVATAGQLARDEASTTTTIPPTTAPEPTTTIAEPTTTIPEPTTVTTTAPDTTTTVAVTTAPPNPTTEPTVAPTAPTTTPPETTAPTTPTTEEATTTTEEATTTTEEATTTTEKATTTTEQSTTTTSVFPLPPGQIAASPDAFMDAWNAVAPASGVATISTWTEKPLVGHAASVANLGGNLRLVLLTDSVDSAVAMAVLAWLPLANASDQAAQNEAFQQAFGVLMQTVSATVTSEQEATVAQQLGLSAATPPFADGTTATASLDSKNYQLRALIPAGQSGVYSLVGVSAAP